jgi:hypothetical protein
MCVINMPGIAATLAAGRTAKGWSAALPLAFGYSFPRNAGGTHKDIKGVQ